VQWGARRFIDAVNLPFTAWTNLQFTVTATASGSLLQFGFRDDPYYLGLDDISVSSWLLPHFRAIAQSPAASISPSTPGRRTLSEFIQDQPDAGGLVNLGAPISSEPTRLSSWTGTPPTILRSLPAPARSLNHRDVKNHVRQQTP